MATFKAFGIFCKKKRFVFLKQKNEAPPNKLVSNKIRILLSSSTRYFCRGFFDSFLSISALFDGCSRGTALFYRSFGRLCCPEV